MSDDETVKYLPNAAFYIECFVLGAPRTWMFETLADALMEARTLEEHGDGSVERIYGPGVDMGNGEWSK